MKRIIVIAFLFCGFTVKAQIQKYKNLEVTNWFKMQADTVTSIGTDSSSTYGSNNKLITERAAKAYARLVGGGGGGSTDTSSLSARIDKKVDSLKVDPGTLSYWINGTQTDRKLKIAQNYYSEASPYLFNGEVKVKSYAVDTAHWWDGTGAFSIGKRMFSFGGWYDTVTTGQIYTNRIRYSDDDGATWTTSTYTLPFSAHSFVYFESRGYWYIIGSDNAHTSLSETVWRTRDMQTFEVMTSAAGWGVRQTMGGFADEYGNLYMGGGQTTTDVSTGHNDIWKSADFGATWTQIVDSISVGGTYFLGQNISNALKYFNGRVYVVGGGILAGSPTYLATVYSVSIDSIAIRTAWRAEQSMPTASQYISVEVWDGKLWAWSGFNTSPGNKNTMYYLNKSGIWSTFLYNYTGNIAANVITATHAAAIVVHNGKLFQILGNGMNQCIELSLSGYLPYIEFRDSILVHTLLIKSKGTSFSGLKIWGGSAYSSHANSGSAIFGDNPANQGYIDYSGSTGVYTFGNTFNSAGLAFKFKVKTSGTPIDALKILGNGTLQPYNLQVGSSTTNASINFQNASSSSGYFEYTGAGQFDFWTHNVHRASITNTAFQPQTSGGLSLGTGTKPFGNIFTNGSIAVGVSAANASAAIHIASTTQGFLLVPMTATQASALTPSNGLFVNVSDTNGTFTAVGTWVYTNGTWTQL